MEVCGGHTHAIYRFGLKDILPEILNSSTARVARYAYFPWAGLMTGSRWPRRPDVIFAAFGDMMRVPGTHGSPLEHKARGMDVRIVYSPSDALEAGAERIPTGT